jgi:hypothetical protein
MHDQRTRVATEARGTNGHVGRRHDLFRAVNEQIEKLVQDSAHFDGSLTVVCECASADCHEEIELPSEVYDAARSAQGHYVIKPGHERPGSDRLVACELAYYIVESRFHDGEQPEAS